MYANYHTHTYLCNHAGGEPEEYVEQAIKNGLKVLGFSDHVPYPFKNGHESYFRMKVEETEKYFEMISRLRDKYKNDIKIYIGFEAEYYPEFFDAMLQNIKGCDYIILGQHFINNEYDSRPSTSEENREAELKQYVSQLCEAADTGKFSYIAHPDVMYYPDIEDEIYKSEMTKLCRHMKEKNIPLEFNLLGMKGGRHYPNEVFWRIAAECKNDTVLGFDAHVPEDTGSIELERRGLAYIKNYGLNLIEKIELKQV